MIASNYRRYPQALALQLVLNFGRRLVWALARPTQRRLREIRRLRAAAFARAGRIAYPVVPPVPAWFVQARRAAQQLAQAVRSACLGLAWAT
ncbi:hypothetical protein GT347_01320 [Xylophilus rhododendri]|uniref:Uncharacterized protein n=1 Tax=Xylophilus rhododendri TaxID=2697032 RepID=A0A857J0N7_9BURK|nr:hypothetical protein [Xylophilus rhododendri]QHI96749.1 hypothetical protein GT347_01320 [Xylophilus rhododendri]